eukprot:g5182.t1
MFPKWRASIPLKGKGRSKFADGFYIGEKPPERSWYRHKNDRIKHKKIPQEKLTYFKNNCSFIKTKDLSTLSSLKERKVKKN